MKKILSLLFHRIALVALFLILQIVVLVLVVVRFHDVFIPLYTFCLVLSVCVAVWVIGSRRESGYKISWIISILAFPVVGGLFYIIFVGNKLPRRLRRRMLRMDEKMEELLACDCAAPSLSVVGTDSVRQSQYLEQTVHCPVYRDTNVTYYPSGEAFFADLLTELRQAETYIFLEYFIIEPGLMWDSMLEILKEKVAQGVEVRVMYDDIGCMFTLPRGYDAILRDMGIQCAIFNPFVPVLSLRLNDRNHRKCCVIDGKVAFTGGVNVADEYINQVKKFGHWKDSAIRLVGGGAWSMAVQFLTLWEYVTATDGDLSSYKPNVTKKVETGGFVQPYTDNPLDDEPVGMTVYLNLINRAKRYIYITTPYLILDDATANALCIAAKSGVDVRIITPHVPDKKLVLELSRANYDQLLLAGVRIFEYTPGFIHAKNFVVDDLYATVGSVNLDYRSLFLHFENGVWLCNDPVVGAVKEDFLGTQQLSQAVTLRQNRDIGLPRRWLRRGLKIFAPLM